MTRAIPLAVAALLFVLSALLAGPTVARRAMAALAMACALAVPFCLTRQPIEVRGFVAFACTPGLLRATDLVTRRGSLSWQRRLVHLASPVDSFRLVAAPAAIAWRSVGRAIVMGALGGASAFVALVVAPGIAGIGGPVVRGASSVVVAYAGVDLVYAALDVVYRAIGFSPGVLHDHPILSRSARELWGKRWARLISVWVDAHAFRPLARRGLPKVGLFAAFLLSALVHLYQTWPPLGLRGAAAVASYFLVQGLVVLVEGPLEVARWPSPLARAWTLVVVGLPGPLVGEAVLRIAAP